MLSYTELNFDYPLAVKNTGNLLHLNYNFSKKEKNKTNRLAFTQPVRLKAYNISLKLIRITRKTFYLKY